MTVPRSNITFWFYKNFWIVFAISFISLFVWAIGSHLTEQKGTWLSAIPVVLLGGLFIICLHFWMHYCVARV